MNQKKIIYDAAVIGAGPAGLIAAITSSQAGKKTVLIEKNDLPGRKLLLSGNGRCNLTNTEEDVTEFLSHFSGTRDFLRNSFHIFFNKHLIAYIKSKGVLLKTEPGGRVFPESNNARDILNVLLKDAKSNISHIALSEDVTDVSLSDKVFTIKTAKDTAIFSRSVVIATGGLSYPKTGSTGFGYLAAKKFGHTVTPASPALVGINTDPVVRSWQGIALKDAGCSLIKDGKVCFKKRGEIIFTHFGLSGPVALDLGADAFAMRRTGAAIYISVDFIPALAYDDLRANIMKELEINPNKNISTVLEAFIPQRMAPDLLSLSGILPEKKCNQITKLERKSAVDRLKDFRFTVRSTRPIEEAMVTRGGVSVKELDPKTMESKLVPGLFFAGEVIDVDAGTGGYNLQAAFSTGYAAAKGIISGGGK